MKRVLGLAGIILTLTICLTAFVAFSDVTAFAADEPDFSVGTELAPCEINSAEALKALSEYVRNGGATYGVRYKVTSPITLTEDFVPIGNANYPFNGNFDGGLHEITLAVSEESYAGLFGYVGIAGVVRNVITAGTVASSDNYAGGIAAYNAGVVENVLNKASVSGVSRTGGVTGENIGTVLSAVNVGDVRAVSYGGGIAGINARGATVQSSVNLGVMKALGSGTASIIGGVVGSNSGTLSDVYNAAAVEVTGERVGSAVGYLLNAGNGSGNVYNLSSESVRSVVGFSEITVPSTFEAKSLYSFLSGETVFSEGGLVQPTFGEGIGYLYAPVFADREGIKEYFQKNLFAAGDGSEASPFIVSNAENWDLFAVNSALHTYEGKYIRLNASLDLGEITPLFTVEGGFSGNFNGGGKRLTYSVNSQSDYVGLFAELGSGSVVHSLLLKAEVSGKNYVGALAGLSQGSVNDVVAESGSVTGAFYVGGIIGKTENGSLSSLENNASVVGTRYVGGITGEAVLAERAVSLVNSGSVGMGSGNAYAYFGGIFGAVQGYGAEKAFVYGRVSAYKADYVGGVAGSVNGCPLTVVAVMNSVTGRNYVGGIVGYSLSSADAVTSAMAVGDVFGAKQAGGIVGASEGNGTVDEVYFYGTMNTVPEAETDVKTFRAIAPDGVTASKAYYLRGATAVPGNGTGINSVQFTEGIFTSENWTGKSQGAGFGYLPALSALSDESLFEATLKINYFGGGKGQDGDPFLVNTETHLTNLTYLVEKYEFYRTAFYLQNAAVTLTEVFSSVGKETAPFCGTYDGGYFAVGSSYEGQNPLFGYVGNGGRIINVAVEGGSYVVASLVKVIEEGGSLETSYSTAKVSGGDDYAGGIVSEGSGYAGGLVSENFGTVESSFYTGRMDCVSTAGGIAGKNKGEIRNCFSSGYIISKTAAGGIAGENEGGVISGAVASGTVSATLQGIAGGLVGKIIYTDTDTVLSDSYVTAIIESERKKGGIAGEVYNTFSLSSTVFFNSNIFTSNIAFYRGESATPGGIYAKTSAEMLSGFESNFTQANFVSNLSPDKDSGYSPRNAVFENTGIARVEELSAYALKIRSFGWDNADEAQWGSAENPYIVTTLEEMNVLRSNVDAGYDYTGYYFRLDANIDFGDVLFRPIGRFVSASDASNRLFGGVFDGNGHTFSSLTLREQPGYGYVALFAYTSKSFALRNLILDESCSVTSLGTDAASFVGYNNGIVENCYSFATVSSQSRAGGIAVFTASSTRISGTVFAGTLAAPNYYGLTAQDAGSVNFDSYNSWYLRKNPEGVFVQAGSEGYLHNNYGNVLFEDRGGAVTVNVSENGFTFALAAAEGFGGVLMNAQDKVEFDGQNGYDPTVNPNVTSSGSTKLYARFVLDVMLENTDFLRTEGASYGQGSYYRGQTVTFTLATEYGLFLNLFDTDDLLGDVTYGNNDSDSVTVTFVVPETGYLPDGENRYTLTVKADVRQFTYYAELIVPTDSVYDGNAKAFTVVPTVGNEGFFGENGFTYTDLGTQAIISSIINAGNYKVKVSLRKAGDTHFAGYHTVEYSVERKVLTVEDYANAKESWENFVAKTYDSSVTAVKNLSEELIMGIVPSDTGKITVSATIVWASASAGETTATVKDFSLSGTAAANYYVSSGEVEGIAASIGKMRLTVKLNKTESEYTGVSPTANYTLVGTLYGTAALKFTFTPQDGVTVYNVGKYNVNVVCTDEANYEVDTEGSMIYTITPKTVKASELIYSVPTLMYDGSDLSSRIKITFKKLNSGNGTVNAVFYKEGEVTDSVVDAGNYVAELSVNDVNYVLEGGVVNYEFTVLRSDKGGVVGVSLSDDGNFEDIVLTYGEGIAITPGELYGADLQVERTVNGRGEAKVILSENGEYLLQLTRYALDGLLTFRFKATGSPNYEDRYSKEITVRTEAGVIYVGVKAETIYYGDAIDLTLVYSTDAAQNEEIDPDSVAGFVPSRYEVEQKGELKAGSYDVSFYGGDSDGYVFRSSDNYSITVSPRPVEIRTNLEIGEEANGKIYGEEDSAIVYKIYDEDTALVTDTLPNGEKITLSGALGREAGEDAGSYAILQGTVTSETNPDYAVTFSGVYISEYVIAKRDIEFALDEVTKSYGQPDPEITFRPTEGYAYMFDDGAEDVTVSVTRQPGENVGEYSYTLSGYDGGNNYRIVSVDYTSSKFRIEKATPTVTFVTREQLRYGSPLSELTLSGSAIDAYGNTVEGTFAWVFPDNVCQPGDNSVAAIFTPNTSNYSAVRNDAVTINVLPRKAEVAFEGATEYVYNGEVQGEFTAALSNAVGEDKVQLIAQEVTSVDAGKYYYTVKLAEDETRYTLEGGAKVEYVIYPAVLTVSVKSATFTEGDRIKTEILYEGFVAGENESVLDTEPTVDSVPSVGGIYFVTPKGGADGNYTFIYVAGTVTVNKTALSDSGVRLEGTFGATSSLSVNVAEAVGLSLYQEQLDKALNYNVFLPNSRYLVSYYELRYTEISDGEIVYTVELPIESGDKIYLIGTDGSVKELSDYKTEAGLKAASEEGESSTLVTVTFTAEPIHGIAVYRSKATTELVMDYIPLGATVIGIVVVVGVVAVIVAVRRKKREKERNYVKKFRD